MALGRRRQAGVQGQRNSFMDEMARANRPTDVLRRGRVWVSYGLCLQLCRWPEGEH